MIRSIATYNEDYIVRKLVDAISISMTELPIDSNSISSRKESNPTDAAVLIPLLRKNGEWHSLFTRRVDTLPEHSGQVAFPGGRFDPTDFDLQTTALRESYEEIGLFPEDVKILGFMPKLLTVTNYLVTPVVGVIPWPYTFNLSKNEVTRVFTIPLEWLANPENYKIQKLEVSGWNQPIPVIYYNQYDGEILWGASARIILAFIKIIS